MSRTEGRNEPSSLSASANMPLDHADFSSQSLSSPVSQLQAFASTPDLSSSLRKDPKTQKQASHLTTWPWKKSSDTHKESHPRQALGRERSPSKPGDPFCWQIPHHSRHSNALGKSMQTAAERLSAHVVEVKEAKRAGSRAQACLSGCPTQFLKIWPWFPYPSPCPLLRGPRSSRSMGRASIWQVYQYKLILFTSVLLMVHISEHSPCSSSTHSVCVSKFYLHHNPLSLSHV